MSRTVRHRTTARVLLLHGRDPVRPEAPYWSLADADGSAANDQLTAMMRAAVSAVQGEA